MDDIPALEMESFPELLGIGQDPLAPYEQYLVLPVDVELFLYQLEQLLPPYHARYLNYAGRFVSSADRYFY